ncbi:hypothetical protein AGMMS49991_08610 [Spirochaetia bacterium]|nr:hypothetical protein AGMMS49991_08610 [Spirochaetia bacterium]
MVGGTTGLTSRLEAHRVRHCAQTLWRSDGNKADSTPAQTVLTTE